jgi:hypothetical protein
MAEYNQLNQNTQNNTNPTEGDGVNQDIYALNVNRAAIPADIDNDVDEAVTLINPLDLNLNKKVYGLRKFRDNVDYKFSEFLPKAAEVKLFFNLYNKYFYQITPDLHNFFFNESRKYAYPEGWVNPREIEIQRLKDQIQTTQDTIDEIEREHPFLKNGKFITSLFHKNNPTAAIEEGKTYYLQSGRKRKIETPAAYYNLKNKIRRRLGPIEESLFLLFLSEACMEGIPNGPSIIKSSDTYISTLEINRYTPTT